MILLLKRIAINNFLINYNFHKKKNNNFEITILNIK